MGKLPARLARSLLVIACIAFFGSSNHAGFGGQFRQSHYRGCSSFSEHRVRQRWDFLRLALPDEIATALSYVTSLSIRPFATTSKYTRASLDLEQAGREMRVKDIVTGHYLKEGDQLQITLEAVDVENNRALWRDTLNVAALDMIAMRGQITEKVRQGLFRHWARALIQRRADASQE